jgi:hypothetical protein
MHEKIGFRPYVYRMFMFVLLYLSFAYRFRMDA